MLFTNLNDRVVATTLKDYARVITENISSQQVILWKLGQMGGIETRPGSQSIVVPIISDTNNTVQSYLDFEPFDMSVGGGIEAAEYAWKFVGGVAQISGPQKFRNSGAATQAIDLWDALGMQLATSMKIAVNRQIFNDGSNGKDIIGLLAAVENGDAWSTYGEIDSNVRTSWRNQFVDAADYHTAANLTNGMRTLYNSCTGGGDYPHLMVTTQTIHEAWEATLQTNERFVREPVRVDEALAQAGFVNFMYKNAAVVWDEGMLPNTTGDDAQGMVALNLNYLKFVMGESYDFRMTPPVTPDNQDSEALKCLLAANIVLSNRRRQGRMDIATA